MPSLFVAYPGMRNLVARFSRPGLYPYAAVILRRAQGNVAVHTGRLRRSGRIVRTTQGLRVVFDASNNGFRYAWIQERRRPYLRPAIRR